MRSTLRVYKNKRRPWVNFVVEKKEGLILSLLQIRKRTDSEIQSSVRMAVDKQKGRTSGKRKHKHRLYSGYSREGGDQSPRGRELTGICCFSEEENALITRLSINCVPGETPTQVATNSGEGTKKLYLPGQAPKEKNQRNEKSAAWARWSTQMLRDPPRHGMRLLGGVTRALWECSGCQKLIHNAGAALSRLLRVQGKERMLSQVSNKSVPSTGPVNRAAPQGPHGVIPPCGSGALWRQFPSSSFSSFFFF